MRIGLARRRLGGIDPVLAMHLIQLLSLGIIWLEIFICERPCRRESAMMAYFAEILTPQTKQSGAVHLRVAAHPIMYAGMKSAAVTAVPGFFRLVPRIHKHRCRVPILALPRQEAAAFQHQNTLAG